MIVTIDGPAGSGKSTVARRLAERLNIPYLDTGAMYRAAALAAVRAGVDLNDADALARLVESCDLRTDCGAGPTRVFLNNEDVSDQIRSAEISAKSSLLARAAAVREQMVNQQRRIARRLGSLVTEGRDQGSVAFPDAEAKFFLTARPDVRARRRLADLEAAGEKTNLPQVLDEVTRRDRADSTRSVGPLQPPSGAVQIDTSDLTVEQVVEVLLARIRPAGPDE